MRFAEGQFVGSNRAIQAKLLAPGVGTESLNQKPGRGDLRAWKNPLTVATVPSGRNTIYRFGRDVASDADYWFAWTGIVHAIRGFLATDPTERTYYTGDGVPKVTDNTIALASTPYPTTARLLGVPAPVDAALLTQSVAGTGTDETRYYVYTYVTDQGEESAPSPLSLPIVCKPGATIALSNLAAPPSGNYGIDRKRIYRTQTGTSGATRFFFLREIGVGSTTSTDDARLLGEEIPSTTWLTPPADLSSLHGLWNGMAAGITGRSVRYCESYKPYAWPIAYETVIPDLTPLALGSFQQTLVILTNGRPYAVTGSSPDAMQEQAIELDQACVSVQSVENFGHGVVWASPDGLCYVGTGGPPRVLTAGLMLREDWQAIVPSSIISGQYEGVYIASYNDGSGRKAFMVDPLSPNGIYFLDTGYQAYYSDRLQDALYVLNGVNVQKWEAGSTFMTTRFRSRVFRSPNPVNMGFAEVVAEKYPVTFRMWANRLNTGTGLMEMVLKKTRTVTKRAPFALPAGYNSDEYQFEIEAAAGAAVQGFAVAETMAELRAL